MPGLPGPAFLAESDLPLSPGGMVVADTKYDLTQNPIGFLTRAAHQWSSVAPHLHWHVIARFQADAHFPAPIWANAQREAQLALPVDWAQQVQAILLR